MVGPKEELTFSKSPLSMALSRSMPVLVSDLAIKLRWAEDVTVICVCSERPEGALPAMVIPPAIGIVLVLIGLALFLVDLKVANHGLPTAGAILSLVFGGLALFGAGVPYAGVLLGSLVAVAMLMGGFLFGVMGSLRASKRMPVITGREGMIGKVGTVRSPVGVESEGWIFVHGERWRAVLAFAPEEADPRDHEAVIGVGRKVAVVGFGDRGVLQVVPVELPRHSSRELDSRT
jgi:membrane protein implicated in regulation of membrane protease activity